MSRLNQNNFIEKKAKQLMKLKSQQYDIEWWKKKEPYKKSKLN
jgi:hypothetical protein